MYMSMEQRKENRRANLLMLVDRFGGGNQTDLANRLRMNPSLFSQIKNRTRGMGEDMAREIERGLGLAEYSMDRPMTGQVEEQLAVGIDVKTLENVIAGFNTAFERFGGRLESMNISGAIAGAYAYAIEEGELPDFSQWVRAAARVSGKE